MIKGIHTDREKSYASLQKYLFSLSGVEKLDALFNYDPELAYAYPRKVGKPGSRRGTDLKRIRKQSRVSHKK